MIKKISWLQNKHAATLFNMKFFDYRYLNYILVEDENKTSDFGSL